MLRAGIQQDWRLAKYHFWHTLMRVLWWADIRIVRLHTYAFMQASKYSPFEEWKQ
jgi:hypothetical protein